MVSDRPDINNCIDSGNRTAVLSVDNVSEGYADGKRSLFHFPFQWAFSCLGNGAFYRKEEPLQFSGLTGILIDTTGKFHVMVFVP